MIMAELDALSPAKSCKSLFSDCCAVKANVTALFPVRCQPRPWCCYSPRVTQSLHLNGSSYLPLPAAWRDFAMLNRMPPAGSFVGAFLPPQTVLPRQAAFGPRAIPFPDFVVCAMIPLQRCNARSRLSPQTVCLLPVSGTDFPRAQGLCDGPGDPGHVGTHKMVP